MARREFGLWPGPMRVIVAAIAIAVLADDCAPRASMTPMPSQPARPIAHRVVRIAQFAFDPNQIIVAFGDTVEWFNADIVPHSVIADSGAWSDPDLPAGGRFRWVADRGGRYPYHCGAHQTMTALLVVGP